MNSQKTLPELVNSKLETDPVVPLMVDSHMIIDDFLPPKSSLEDTLYYVKDPSSRLKPQLKFKKILAKGGMSKVFLVESAGRKYALKLSDEVFQYFPQLFKREVKTQIASARLIPVPEIYEAGQDAKTEQFYIIMEYISGDTLRKAIDRKYQPFSTQEVLQKGIPIAHNLHLLHSNGIIHQDIKPGNIIINGKTYFIDFGLAKQTGDSNMPGEINSPGRNIAIGTPYYMAPEVALANAEVDIYAEQYSLGVVLYELLTGNVPTLTQNYTKITDPREINACPDKLAKLVMKCLDFEPEKRFPSCGHVARELRTFAQETGYAQ